LMSVERGTEMPPRVRMDYKPHFYVPREWVKDAGI